MFLSTCLKKIILLTMVVWLLSLCTGVHRHYVMTDTTGVASLAVSMDLLEGDDLASHQRAPHVDVYNDYVQLHKDILVHLDLIAICTAIFVVCLLSLPSQSRAFIYSALPNDRIVCWRPQLRAPPVLTA